MTRPQKFKYFKLWQAACKRNGWKSSDRVKRMEIHRLALGSEKSSETLTNRDLDWVYAALELAIDPDNLNAQLKLDSRDGGPLKRVMWSLDQYEEEPLVRSICRDKFGTVEWTTLSLQQARQLLMTVQRHYRQQGKREGQVEVNIEADPETDTTEQPATFAERECEPIHAGNPY